MKITIWGARGSIAAPGVDMLRYGGNTTCIEVRSTADEVILIDAGTGVRQAGKAIRRAGQPRTIRFFFTHSHWDHLVGFPFFEPAYFPEYRLTFCGGQHAQDSIRRYLGHQMEAPYFPVDFSNLRAEVSFRCDRAHTHDDLCELGDLRVRQVPLNHPNGGYGFRFTERSRSFVFLTDNELGYAHPGGLDPAGYADFCHDADLLMHDAQYTDAEYEVTRGWGHATFRDAVDLAVAAGVKQLALFHHDPDRTDVDLDAQVAWCRARLREAGSDVRCFAATEGQVLEL